MTNFYLRWKTNETRFKNKSLTKSGKRNKNWRKFCWNLNFFKEFENVCLWFLTNFFLDKNKTKFKTFFKIFPHIYEVTKRANIHGNGFKVNLIFQTQPCAFLPKQGTFCWVNLFLWFRFISDRLDCLLLWRNYYFLCDKNLILSQRKKN